MDLQTLRSRARLWLNIPDAARLPNQILDDLFNEAQQHIMEIGELLWGDSVATFSLTAGTNSYVPTIAGRVIVSPIKMFYVDATAGEKGISQVSYAAWADRYPDPTATDSVGDGADYSVYGTDATGNPVFYIGPTPNADQSGVQLVCRTRFADLVNDDDDNDMTNSDSGWKAILYRALSYACVFVDKEDRQPTFEALFRVAYTRLLISHGRARNAGKRAPGMREPG